MNLNDLIVYNFDFNFFEQKNYRFYFLIRFDIYGLIREILNMVYNYLIKLSFINIFFIIEFNLKFVNND